MTDHQTPSSEIDPVSEPTERSPREEIEELLASDRGRLGDVFRRPTMSPEEVAQELDVASFAFVYNARRMIEAIVDGRPVKGPAFRKQVLGAFRTQMARGKGRLSSEALELLERNRAAIEAAGALEDPAVAAREAEEEQIEAATTLRELEGVAGIYAFSFGWYLESPVDPERGNTLIKVGRSTNVAQRIRAHTSAVKTAIPEPLALIRVYATGERSPDEVERITHELLRTAGHNNPRRTTQEGGSEWFLTNEDFLDSIAKALRLRTVYTGRSEFATD